LILKVNLKINLLGENYLSNITHDGNYRILLNGQIGTEFIYKDLYENYYTNIFYLKSQGFLIFNLFYLKGII
jgi:hypothetical protein